MPLLDYASPRAAEDLDAPPNWRRIAYRLRYPFLVLYALLLGGAVGFCAWTETVDTAAIVAVLLVVLGSQGLFLVGAPQLRWPRRTGRVPMAVSLTVGALVAALLTFGVVATALNAVDRWEAVTGRLGGYVFGLIGAFWAVWLALFATMWAGQWLGGYRKLYRLLVMGTWLELLVTIPVDVHVRRRTNCYCGEGTFVALVIGSSVALWSFGPGIVLLFLTRRLERDGYFGLCRRCAHDLRTTPAGTRRCPGCGARVPERLRRGRRATAPVAADGR
jgi:hypothetical protein